MVLQLRHLPPRNKYEMTGILSYHWIDVSQKGHAEPGITIDLSCGIRQIQTCKKLPNIKPKRPVKNNISSWGIVSISIPLTCLTSQNPLICTKQQSIEDYGFSIANGDQILEGCYTNYGSADFDLKDKEKPKTWRIIQIEIKELNKWKRI